MMELKGRAETADVAKPQVRTDSNFQIVLYEYSYFSGKTE